MSENEGHPYSALPLIEWVIRTLYLLTACPRASSPPGDPLSPDGDSPCLATQFTLKDAKDAK